MPKLEPARWFAIVAALVALAAYYVDLPGPLIVGLAAAILGTGGEIVRAHVTPTAKTETSEPV